MIIIPRLYTTILANLPPVPSRVAAYKTAQTTTTNENATTFSFSDIGTPHPKRIIVAACYHGVAAACTATCNGIDAYFRSQNTAHEFSIHAFQVVAGTSASVVVTAASSIRKAVALYVIYPENHMPLDSGQATANTTTNANVADMKIQAGGYLIYVGGQHATLGTFTTTWNGTDAVTEDVDAQLEAAGSYTMGHIDCTVGSDANDLDMAESTSGTKRLCVATWGPPNARRV